MARGAAAEKRKFEEADAAAEAEADAGHATEQQRAAATAAAEQVYLKRAVDEVVERLVFEVEGRNSPQDGAGVGVQDTDTPRSSYLQQPAPAGAANNYFVEYPKEKESHPPTADADGDPRTAAAAPAAASCS